MSVAIDKDLLKEALRELKHKDIDAFNHLIKEVVEEQSLPEGISAEFDALMKKNFEQYAETFKALA